MRIPFVTKDLRDPFGLRFGTGPSLGYVERKFEGHGVMQYRINQTNGFFHPSPKFLRLHLVCSLKGRVSPGMVVLLSGDTTLQTDEGEIGKKPKPTWLTRFPPEERETWDMIY